MRETGSSFAKAVYQWVALAHAKFSACTSDRRNADQSCALAPGNL